MRVNGPEQKAAVLAERTFRQMSSEELVAINLALTGSGISEKVTGYDKVKDLLTEEDGKAFHPIVARAFQRELAGRLKAGIVENLQPAGEEVSGFHSMNLPAQPSSPLALAGLIGITGLVGITRDGASVTITLARAVTRDDVYSVAEFVRNVAEAHTSSSYRIGADAGYMPGQVFFPVERVLPKNGPVPEGYLEDFSIAATVGDESRHTIKIEGKRLDSLPWR